MNKKAMKQTARQGLMLVLCVALVLGVGFLILLGLQQLESRQVISNVPSRAQNITYMGKDYTLNKNVESILVMGLDQTVITQGGSGYRNDMQSEIILLVVMNHETKTVDLLQLNRDTITKIRRPGVGGSYDGQLALAYSYGSGGSDSCLNAVKAVSELLGDVPIQHYLTLPLDALAQISDTLGGVEVQLKDDFSAIDPTMTQGQSVKLNGEQALAYIRPLPGVESTSDISIMDRQRQYIRALFSEIIGQGSNALVKIGLGLGPEMSSDLTVSQIAFSLQTVGGYTMGDILIPAGNAVAGSEAMEFHVDTDDLQSIIVRTYYKEIA